MKFQKALGITIRNIRKKKQFTQESLTMFASRSYLSEIENGKSEPSISKVIQLAQYMNVHPLTILTQAFLNTDSKLNLDDLQKEIVFELKTNENFKK
jgi:transcriptional regulator with XRE-family HTH domain